MYVYVQVSDDSVPHPVLFLVSISNRVNRYGTKMTRTKTNLPREDFHRLRRNPNLAMDLVTRRTTKMNLRQAP